MALFSSTSWTLGRFMSVLTISRSLRTQLPNVRFAEDTAKSWSRRGYRSGYQVGIRNGQRGAVWARLHIGSPVSERRNNKQVSLT